MDLKDEILVGPSRRRILLACTVGVSFAIGAIFSLTIPGLIFGSGMQSYSFTSSKSEIVVEKLILLDYFLFMPWPVMNLRRVAYFQEIGYPRGFEQGAVQFTIVVHSVLFFLGALLAVTLSGAQQQGETDLQRKETGLLPPWGLYTLLLLSAHLALMGAAATYYTGPGGPAWVYPSPFFLIPFALWIGVLSYLTQFLTREKKLGYYALILIITFYLLLLILLIYYNLT